MKSVIIAGGGSGRRIGSKPKAFLKVGGRELIYYSLDIFYGRVDEIIVVLPLDDIPVWEKKIKVGYKDIKFVEGGEHRQDSIKNAIGLLDANSKIVFIHDVARPFLSVNLFERIKEETIKNGACVPFVYASDTLKEKNGEIVKKTLDRSRIVQIQTPQSFRVEILKEAYIKAYKDNFYGSDDSVLVERIGSKVYLIEGERENIKITYPIDIILANTILQNGKYRNNLS